MKLWNREIRNQKSEIRNITLIAVIVGILLAIIFYAMFHHAQAAQAQGSSGGANFAQPFSVTMAATETILAIKNFGQAAGSVQFKGVTGEACPVLLEGSADDLNWSVLAGSPPGTGGSSFFFYANGFPSYYRLAFNPGNNSSCNGFAVTGSYYGYTVPLPINPADEWTMAGNVGSPEIVQYAVQGPVAVDSVQCTNAGSAIAYLQLFADATTPTLGSSFFFQIGIAAGETFSSGRLSPYITPLQLWAGASTTVGGSTAGGPLFCDLQLNVTGPFYPLLPAAP